MHCQRARIIATPLAYQEMEGKELWVEMGTPQHHTVYSSLRKTYVEYPRGYATPYTIGERWFGLEAHRIEWLARGPEDFADVAEVPLAEWLTENGLDLSFE